MFNSAKQLFLRVTDYTRFARAAALTAALLVAGQSVQAAVEIVITKGDAGARPVAIVPFKFESSGVTARAPHDFAQIISNDLLRSGKFRPIAIADMPQIPATEADLDAARWRELGVEAVAVGMVRELQPGQYQISYSLIDPFRTGDTGSDEALRTGSILSTSDHILISQEADVTDTNFRRYAHQVADLIYEKLTGERGAFDTQIAYVAVNRQDTKPFQLFIADSDGYDPQRILASTRPIMSPSWAPDGQRLTYVSFEDGRSEIYVHNVRTAEREKLVSYDGINSAPAFSPDGTQLAMTLSKDGNPEIYVMDMASKRLSRLTRHSGIDTEPEWAPDGRSIIFTSNRGRRPQIYQISMSGGSPKRLTFEGDYNAGAQFTPDGENIVMVHRVNGVYHIAVQNLASGNIDVVTETQLDESPTIAPNGGMVIYATSYRGQQLLGAVSVDGRFKARLPSSQGDVKAPAWSPFFD